MMLRLVKGAARGFATGPCKTSACANAAHRFLTVHPLTGGAGDAVMNAQTKKQSHSCVWCGQPVARRLCLVLIGPSVMPGQPHRWLFCSLLCLQGWAAAERAPPPDRPSSAELAMPGSVLNRERVCAIVAQSDCRASERKRGCHINRKIEYGRKPRRNPHHDYSVIRRTHFPSQATQRRI